MTVRELIDQLETFDPTLKVMVSSMGAGGLCDAIVEVYDGPSDRFIEITNEREQETLEDRVNE